MTEAEWISCTDPGEMLRYVQANAKERKSRMFAVACCRRIWNLITEVCCRQAVEASERYADDEVSHEDLELAFIAADRIHSSPPRPGGLPSWDALDAARLAAHPELRGLADGTATAAAMAGARRGSEFWESYASEQTHQCVLLRDIFGNPFRPVTLDPSWLTWNGGTVHDLATAVYADRAFDRLPLLADALEDAGCTDAELLAHCRSGGEHVRGCWAVDLLLGKK